MSVNLIIVFLLSEAYDPDLKLLQYLEHFWENFCFGFCQWQDFQLVSVLSTYIHAFTCVHQVVFWVSVALDQVF